MMLKSGMADIVIGGAVGIVFAILPVIFPKQEKYLPSASGFGLAWIFQWYYGVLFFMGAVIAWWFAKKSPAKAEEFTFPVASGVMAGGALMGVIGILLALQARAITGKTLGYTGYSTYKIPGCPVPTTDPSRQDSDSLRVSKR